MSSDPPADDCVLTRRLDVTSRLAASVRELSDLSEDGLLLETLIGRYVLDRDGRTVWMLLDGRRDVAAIAAAIVDGDEGLVEEEVVEAVRAFCAGLLDLGLVEPAGSAVVAERVR